MEQQQRSPIADLAKAYTRAWAEVQNVVKNAHNPHFGSNYADLGAVIDTVKGVFSKHELAMMQSPGLIVAVEGVLCQELKGVLIHSSGQTIPMNMMIPLGTAKKPEPQPAEPSKQDWKAKKKGGGGEINAQKAGGVITYARRYQLASVAGIAQVDDDGNGTQEEPEELETFDRDDLEGRIKACTTYEELNGTGTGKKLVKSKLREDVEATGDAALGKLFSDKREELKKAKAKE